jgi:serine protease inhibitor
MSNPPGRDRRRPPVGRRTRRTALVATILSLGIAACGDSPTGPVERITELPRALSPAEALLIDASNDFAVDLLRTVYDARPDSTIFLSPLSASVALGMTLNGAAGETRAQMAQMLGFEGLALTEVNASYRDLVALLTELDPLVRFDLGNAIFHREAFVMETPFLDRVRRDFAAEIAGLDFDDPSAVDVINGWASDATQGRIPKVIDDIDPTTMAFLMNAIYFKGDWTKEFDEADSYDGPFLLQGGGEAPVRFMTKEDTLGYRASEAWHAAEIPYGGGAWAMTIAVPRAGHDVQDIVADLGTLLDPAAEWSEVPLAVHLPKLELEWERVLNDDLRALGMLDAFVPWEADFTPMYARALEEQLHVQFVKQNTFLKVDEVGTEAAAVTVVGVGVVCAGCGGPIELRADRPFVIAIRERISGTVLFVGVIIQAPVA